MRAAVDPHPLSTCTMAPSATKKPLASKEANLFKELLALYETRQLKKGIKTADLILKKNPDNGGMWRHLLFAQTRFLTEHRCRDAMYEGFIAHAYGQERGRA